MATFETPKDREDHRKLCHKTSKRLCPESASNAIFFKLVTRFQANRSWEHSMYCWAWVLGFTLSLTAILIFKIMWGEFCPSYCWKWDTSMQKNLSLIVKAILFLSCLNKSGKSAFQRRIDCLLYNPQWWYTQRKLHRKASLTEHLWTLL